MGQSALTNTTNPALQGLKILSSGDFTIYVGSTGNDAWEGTESRPFASLYTAWTEAKKYTIYGSNTLYVTLLKGVYNITDPTNWFPSNYDHPQGGNIVIQGDTRAINQKYLTRVAKYSYDLSSWSVYGHTGDVQLWSAATGLTHGYTAQDAQGWMAISNASMGTVGEYYVLGGDGIYDSRNSSTNDTVRNLYGNRFFNHGFSYEDGMSIVGLAKIQTGGPTGVTARGNTLGLVFKNQNVDGRAFSFTDSSSGRLGGGIGNASPWAGGVANNAPSVQYGQPNGFYGATYAATTPHLYPTRAAGEVYVSDDIYLATSYPVVLNVTPGSTITGRRPFAVSGARLKGIANLMICNSALNGSSGGSEPRRAFWLGQNSGTQPCFDLHDADIALRHIGIYGFSTSIVAYNSQIRKYTNAHNNASSSYNSALGSLENTPILNCSHTQVGIELQNGSNLAFSETPGTAYAGSRSDASMCIQSHPHGILAYSASTAAFDSAVIIGSPSPGGMFIQLNLPYWAGHTGGVGASSGVYDPSYWTSGNLNSAILRTTTGVTLARLSIAGVGGSTFGTALGAWGVSAGWSGAVWTGVATQPLYTQTMTFYGNRLTTGVSAAGINSSHMAMDTDYLRRIATDGVTLEIIPYNTLNESSTTLLSRIRLGKNAIELVTAGGSGITGTSAGAGFSLGFLGVNGLEYNGISGIGVFAGGGSRVDIYRNCVIRNKEEAIYAARNNSVINLHESHIMLTCFAHSGLLAGAGNAEINGDHYGSIWAKNPSPFGPNGFSQAGDYSAAVQPRQGASMRLYGNLVSVGRPTATYAFTTYAGLCLGLGGNQVKAAPAGTFGYTGNPIGGIAAVQSFYVSDGHVWLSNGGALYQPGGYNQFGRNLFVKDGHGDIIHRASIANYALYNLSQDSILTGMDSTKQHGFAKTTTSGVSFGKIMTRGSALYNQPATSNNYRWWQDSWTNATSGGGEFHRQTIGVINASTPGVRPTFTAGTPSDSGTVLGLSAAGGGTADGTNNTISAYWG